MSEPKSELKVVVIKPSKYRPGHRFVERFRWGFMANATRGAIASMIPDFIGDIRITTVSIDECVETDLGYMKLLNAKHNGCKTLVLLVGVQSHQFHRAADLAAYAVAHGCMAVIGGPHPMTCDTTIHQGRGVSFCLSEAEALADPAAPASQQENVLMAIIKDAVRGELQDVYGTKQRWAEGVLNSPVLKMPDKSEFRKHVSPYMGIYCARGCPYPCTFCSVTKIAGRRVRSQPVQTTIASLHAAANAGVKIVFFTSDNFNKYKDGPELCYAIIEEGLQHKLKFFVQCDTTIVKQPELVDLYARAGVFQMFLGVESLNLAALKEVNKNQNRPELYRQIREMLAEAGINSHFSTIVGFRGDTLQSAREQREGIAEINPDLASSYVLCPIPGTEDYDAFMKEELVVEKNLDRFDGTYPTWRHPHMSWPELHQARNQFYHKVFSLSHLAAYRPHGKMIPKWEMALCTAFFRKCALVNDHPMSGGIFRRDLDCADDYREYRHRTFGFEFFPLPKSLKLSEKEAYLNRTAKIEKAYL